MNHVFEGRSFEQFKQMNWENKFCFFMINQESGGGMQLLNVREPNIKIGCIPYDDPNENLVDVLWKLHYEKEAGNTPISTGTENLMTRIREELKKLGYITY